MGEAARGDDPAAAGTGSSTRLSSSPASGGARFASSRLRPSVARSRKGQRTLIHAEGSNCSQLLLNNCVKSETFCRCFCILMASSYRSTISIYYCCVFKGSRTLYSYSSGDQELESSVGIFLDSAPSFHAWYFHTMGGRTYGFLFEDGHIYFAIADPVLDNSKILRFLEHLRDGFKKVAKSGFQEELVPIVRRLIESLDNVSRPVVANVVLDTEGLSSSDGSVSTMAPLLGKMSFKHERKKKDRGVDVRDVAENHADKGVNIDVSPEPMASISLQKTTSFTRLRNQQMARGLWCRKVRIIIAIDVLICLVLFAIWLTICKGFECVSQR